MPAPCGLLPMLRMVTSAVQACCPGARSSADGPEPTVLSPQRRSLIRNRVPASCTGASAAATSTPRPAGRAGAETVDGDVVRAGRPVRGFAVDGFGALAAPAEDVLPAPVGPPAAGAGWGSRGASAA